MARATRPRHIGSIPFAERSHRGAFLIVVASVTALALSAPSFAGTDRKPPSTPTGLTTTAVLSDEVDLSWNASTDNRAAVSPSYTIYRDGNVLDTTLATSFADRTVSPATDYTYTVDAFDRAGNHSAQSSPLSVTTKQGAPDAGAPSSPTNVHVTDTYAH